MILMDPEVNAAVIGFMLYIIAGWTIIFILNIKGAGDKLAKYEDINRKVAVRFAAAIILLWPISPLFFNMAAKFYNKEQKRREELLRRIKN